MNTKILNKIYLFVLVSALFFACNDTTNVGMSLIPENDLIVIGTNDTMEIQAYTYKIDSTITSSSSYAIIGSYIDPVFGSVQSSFVSQTKIEVSTDFGTLPELDSIVLQLRYKSTVPVSYGHTINSHSLNVYEIDYDLTADTTYYSNFNQERITKKEPALASINYSYNNRDNDSILFIKLSDTYGNKILNSISDWTDADFNDYFNGIWIKPADNPEDGSITFFDINSTDTKVILYYQNSDEDSLSYDFVINSLCFRMNLFTHNYGNILTDLDNPEAQQDTVVYVQGFQGLKSKILIPELDILKEEGGWAVNKAELIATITNESDIESYSAPTQMSIYGINDEDEMIYLNQYLASDSYLGIINYENKYKFDITHRVQQILAGEANNDGFYILAMNALNNPSRVILGGANHQNRMKLVLTLTKI